MYVCMYVCMCRASRSQKVAYQTDKPTYRRQVLRALVALSYIINNKLTLFINIKNLHFMKKIYSFILAAVLCCTSNVWAGELTVADGNNASSDVPFSGQFGYSYQRNQIIYPQSELAAMAGKDIIRLTFYVKSQAPSALGVTVQIGLAEATKFFRDGQLLIEKNGKIYNVMGAEVK